MSSPDIQYFSEDGTWVKPPGADRVTVVLKGGDSTLAGSGNGGGAFFEFRPAGGGGGAGIAAAPAHGSGDGELAAHSLRAGGLPPEVDVRVGEGGFALIVTHLTEGEQP